MNHGRGTASITRNHFIAQGGLVSRSFALRVLPVNDAPNAPDQTFTLAEDSSLTFSIAATDPDGDPLSYEIIGRPLRGILSGTAPQLTYRPRTDFFGNDSCR